MLFAHPGLDQYVRLHGADWNDYERLTTRRAERADPRLTYLDGELELMIPSIEHEGDKKRLRRLIETCMTEPSQTQALRTLRAGFDHTTKRDASHEDNDS